MLTFLGGCSPCDLISPSQIFPESLFRDALNDTGSTFYSFPYLSFASFSRAKVSLEQHSRTKTEGEKLKLSLFGLFKAIKKTLSYCHNMLTPIR